jgi:hypothetical protein
MARIVSCRICRVECERVPLAGGRAALICVTCDLVGLAHEIELGAPASPAEQGRKQGRGSRA